MVNKYYNLKMKSTLKVAVPTGNEFSTFLCHEIESNILVTSRWHTMTFYIWRCFQLVPFLIQEVFSVVHGLRYMKRWWGTRKCPKGDVCRQPHNKCRKVVVENFAHYFCRIRECVGTPFETMTGHTAFIRLTLVEVFCSFPQL